MSKRICDGVISKIDDYCPDKAHVFVGEIEFPPYPSASFASLDEWENTIIDLLGATFLGDTDITAVVAPSDQGREAGSNTTPLPSDLGEPID